MRILMVLAAVSAMGSLSACQTTPSALAAGETGRLVVAPLQAGAQVTVAEVGSPGTGWVVVHPVKDGAPDMSAPLGRTHVLGGPSRNVVVPLGRALAPGEQAAVMLHRDTGNAKVFEFANGGVEALDQPVLVDGAPVVEVVTAN